MAPLVVTSCRDYIHMLNVLFSGDNVPRSLQLNSSYAVLAITKLS